MKYLSIHSMFYQKTHFFLKYIIRLEKKIYLQYASENVSKTIQSPKSIHNDLSMMSTELYN